MAGYYVETKRNPNTSLRSKIIAMGIGAVIMNAGAEIFREAEVYARGYTPKNGGFYMPASWGETAKDAYAAMVGAGGAVLQQFPGKFRPSFLSRPQTPTS